MTVRFYVASTALLIFSWLAITFLRDVPMESYPHPPDVVVAAPVEDPLPAKATAPRKSPVRFISTTTP